MFKVTLFDGSTRTFSTWSEVSAFVNSWEWSMLWKSIDILYE